MEWQNVGYEEDNDNIHSWKVIKNNGRSQIKLTSRWRLSVPCPASRSSFCLLEWGEKRLCLNGVKALRWHLVFCHQTGLFKSEHPFLDKPMVTTTHAVTSAQQLDLVQDYILATCCTCSPQILLDLCRLFLKSEKIVQGKENVCCQGEVFHNRCTSTRDIPFFYPSPKDDGFSNRRDWQIWILGQIFQRCQKNVTHCPG